MSEINLFNWNTDEEALVLASFRCRYEVFEGASGDDVGSARGTISVALADIDGDSGLNLLEGNCSTTQANWLFLNAGVPNFFLACQLTGNAVGSDSDGIQALALGDMDRDGDVDMLAAKFGEANRLYLNSGGSLPFDPASSRLALTDPDDASRDVALGDVNGVGKLEAMLGNDAEPNLLYLNNGGVNPFNGSASAIGSSDSDNTQALALGDIDNNGDLDVVVGNNGELNRYYLNNGSASPYSGIANGSAIGSDTANTHAIALGDIDRDGDLDINTGSGTEKRFYLNDGSGGFSSVLGFNDSLNTTALGLADMDGNGHLDLVTGNSVQIPFHQ